MSFNIFSLLLILGQLTAMGTVTPKAEQSCTVHFNKPFYVSGETVYYKLYFPPAFNGERTVIASSVYDDLGLLIDRSYIRLLEDRTADGFFKVPYEWTSGMYRFVFSVTEQTAAQPIILSRAAVAIYNDFSSDLPQATTSEEQASDYEKPLVQGERGLNISVDTDQSVYSYGVASKIKIRVTDTSGAGVRSSVSVAVNDAVLTIPGTPKYHSVYPGNTWNSAWVPHSFIVVKGALSKGETGDSLQSNLLMAYFSPANQALYSPIDNRGRFIFALPEFYDRGELQLVPEEGAQIDMPLQLQVNQNERPEELVFTPQILNYLEWSRKRKKIYQLYGRVVEAPPAEKLPPPPAIVEPDWYFKLDQYESFEDIPTFFKEVLAPLKFRIRKKTGLQARMYDPTQAVRNFYEGTPLFIVDGQLTRNTEFIAGMDISKIEQIDLYFVFNKLRSLFGPLGYQGVVVIHSRNGDLQVPEADRKNQFMLYGFQPSLKYPVQLATNTEIPLFTPNIYWSPRLSTDENGYVNITVPNAQDASTFSIEVIARDGAGRMGGARAHYQVQAASK